MAFHKPQMVVITHSEMPRASEIGMSRIRQLGKYMIVEYTVEYLGGDTSRWLELRSDMLESDLVVVFMEPYHKVKVWFHIVAGFADAIRLPLVVCAHASTPYINVPNTRYKVHVLDNPNQDNVETLVDTIDQVYQKYSRPDWFYVMRAIIAMHDRKSTDYGTGRDPLANLRLADQVFGIPAWQATMIRATDKVFRIGRFAQKGQLRNESVEDSLLDLANYGIIATTLYYQDQFDQLSKATNAKQQKTD